MGRTPGMTPGEKTLRVHTVFNMLLAGKSSATVCEHCITEYKITRATAYRYMNLADKLMASTLKSKRIAKINRAVGQREMLLEKLLDTEQYAMAAQLMADTGKLQGLYEQTESTDVNITLKIK